MKEETLFLIRSNAHKAPVIIGCVMFQGDSQGQIEPVFCVLLSR